MPGPQTSSIDALTRHPYLDILQEHVCCEILLWVLAIVGGGVTPDPKALGTDMSCGLEEELGEVQPPPLQTTRPPPDNSDVADIIYVRPVYGAYCSLVHSNYRR